MSSSTTNDAGSGSTPAFASGLFAAMVVLSLIAVALTFAGRQFGHAISLAGYSESGSKREIVVGNSVLRVPENNIRFADQRIDGIVSQLELFGHWPDLGGYSAARADAFNNLVPEQPIIFISVAPKQMPRAMSERLAPIYSKLIVADGQIRPDGLVRHGFKDDGVVFKHESLLVSEADGSRLLPFVARCIDLVPGASPEDPKPVAPCQRDIIVAGELSVRYRFSEQLLPAWRELDGVVTGMIETMIADASRMTVE